MKKIIAAALSVCIVSASAPAFAQQSQVSAVTAQSPVTYTLTHSDAVKMALENSPLLEINQYNHYTPFLTKCKEK